MTVSIFYSFTLFTKGNRPASTVVAAWPYIIAHCHPYGIMYPAYNVTFMDAQCYPCCCAVTFNACRYMMSGNINSEARQHVQVANARHPRWKHNSLFVIKCNNAHVTLHACHHQLLMKKGSPCRTTQNCGATQSSMRTESLNC
jgi:hypothetical protein